jgi:hypothetical protein
VSARDFPSYPAGGRLSPTGVPGLSSRASTEQREAHRRRELEYVQRALETQRRERAAVLARRAAT